MSMAFGLFVRELQVSSCAGLKFFWDRFNVIIIIVVIINIEKIIVKIKSFLSMN